MPIRQLKSGSFQVDVQVNGERIRETIDGSMKEAKAREAAIKRDPHKALRERSKGHHRAPLGASGTLSDALWSLYRDEWSRSTAGGYKSSIKIVECFFGSDTPLGSIDTPAIRQFVYAEQRKGRANTTINRRLAVLSKALQWAEEHGIIEHKPKIPRQEEMKTRVRYFEKEEVKQIRRLFEQLNQVEMARFVTVLFGTGARPGEAMRLKTSDIDLRVNQVILSARKKGGGERRVPMKPSVRRALEAQANAVGAGLLFRFSYDSFEYHWDVVRGLLGMQDDPGFVPYTLRHSFGTLQAQEGTDLASISALMGHKRADQTMAYIKIHDKHRQQAMDNYPDLDD